MSFRLTHPLISLDTGKDLSSATNPEIHYRKPNGDVGEWAGTISGENIQYQPTNNDIDQEGRWQFQAVATFGGSLEKGEIVAVDIDEPIKTT